MKKNKKENFNLEYSPYDFENEDKYYNIFLKFVIGVSFSVSINAILIAFGISSVLLAALISLVTIPTVYVGITKIKDKSDKIFKRDMYEANMIGSYLKEALACEHNIDKKTTFFMKEIGEYKFNMDIDNLMNINQLLFLINQSYYESIVSSGVDLSRHELVIKILDQIAIHTNATYQKDTAKFTLKDAKSVINGCYFITDDIKKDLFNHFSNAQVKSPDRTSFVIQPNDPSITEELTDSYFKSLEYTLSSFDVNDIKNYEMLFNIYKEYDKNPYKDAFLVEWDLETIRDCMALIVRRFGIIIEKRTNELYHCEMVSTFIFNLNAYASVNKVNRVGIREIINTFKAWSFFDIQLKIDILDAIFEEFNLDYSMHPYHKMAKKEQYGKTYQFPGYKEKK